MRNIRLYIGGQRADLDSSVTIPFTFQTSDAEMPTAVKNSYSKTVTLQGTDTNRRLFGGLWHLDSIVANPVPRDPEYIDQVTESGASFYERSTPAIGAGRNRVEVQKVYGKSVVFNQLLHGDFPSDYTTWWESYTWASVSDGVVSGTFPADSSSGAYFCRLKYAAAPYNLSGHKIYIHFDYIFNSSTKNAGMNGNGVITAQTFSATSSWTRKSFLLTAANNNRLTLSLYSVGGAKAGDSYQVKNIVLIDLTQMFGSGNEPATASDFEAMFPLDYYTYNAGSFLNQSATDLQTLDAGNSVLSTIPLNLTSLTSGGTAVFPDGLKGVGGVYDEISETAAVKRLGIYDLGLLTWVAPDYSGTHWRVASTTPPTGIKGNSDNSTNANVLCLTLMTDSNNHTYQHTADKTISINSDGRILIYDTYYSTNSSTAAQIKSHLSGVYLIYELATPVSYTLDTPQDWMGESDENGKQKELPAHSATPATMPLDCDLEYSNYVTYPLPKVFNPMKRVDFLLYVDEMIVERGYCQLTAINRKGRDITFSVSLFGGLGEFFYNLQTDEDGEKRNLASLDYGSDLGFKINGPNVQSNWDDLLGGTLPKVAFVPMHNGVPKNMDGDKMLVAGGGLPQTITDGGNTYGAKSGYLLAKLNRKYTEWEIGDLRSYLQRPALRMFDFIQAITNPANNGGWKVNLDTDFFANSNPYYWNTYLLLPQLNVEEETEDICDDGSVDAMSDYPSTVTRTTSLDLASGGCMTIVSDQVDMSSCAANAYLKLSIPVQLAVTGLTNQGDLYLTNRVSHHTENKAICMMVAAWDDGGNLIGVSPRYVFTSKSHRDEIGDLQAPAAPYATTDAQIAGYFTYTGGEYVFRLDENNSNTFALTIDKIPRPSSANHYVRLDFYLQMTTAGIPTLNKKRKGENSSNVAVSNTQFQARVLSGSNNYIQLVEPTQYATDSHVSQEALFGGLESTPLEILLSYTKRFGLMWVQENSEKEVSVYARKNYYTGAVSDIHDQIDYSKGQKVTPVAAESNNYVLGDEAVETTLADTYLARFGRNYGEVRLKTGYDFGSEKVELFEKCAFKEVVDGALSGSGYWDYHNSGGDLPSPIADGMKVTYYFDSGGTTSTKDMEYNLFTVGSVGKKNSPALGCASKADDGEEDAEEVAPALVFFQGGQVPGTWHLTDDIAAMQVLNNAPCWIWDVSLSPARVPRFGRVATFSGDTYSLDFGTPKETFYIPEVSLAPEQAIYSRWWEKYLTDLLSRDTKKAECYVVFPPHLDMRQEMRKFFLFDRSLWVLNKVTDYDPTKVQPVKCEFIRVMSKDAYLTY